MRFHWSREAGRDRDDIFSFIAIENFAAAVTNDEKISAIEDQLSHFPQSGRAGRVAGTREWVITGTAFLAIYSTAGDQLTVLRVIHGAQSWPPER